MYKDMDPYELEMGLNRMRHFYPELELTDEQAVKMLEVESSLEVSSDVTGRRMEMFSFWEQQMYELDKAHGFLTSRQLAIYEHLQRSVAEQHETLLAEQDVKEASEVALTEEYTKWLKESFVPAMRRDLVHVPIVFLMEREKVEYLRAEYKGFCAVSRQNAIIRHYRHSHDLEPNKLKMVLLYQDRQVMLPNYESFISEADEAVKSVGRFLIDKYRIAAERGAEFFKRKSEESEKQYADMRKRHIGEREISGWHTTIFPQGDLTQAQHDLMSMMLI